MRVGSYEVLRTIGQGGMGVVFAARAPDGSDVAVKVLRGARSDAVARFERERRLLASLGADEGFVPVLGGGVAPQPFLVMPLLTGGTLRSKLAAGPLGIDETIALGRSLARALGSAHARGIVHRDVKPENVLFTAEGRPLVADLGLAKHFDVSTPGASQSVSLSGHGELRGTAGYMAPEQMADAKSTGPPSDVFALGAILYECLVGRSPFVGDSPLDVLTKVAEGRFEPVRKRRPETPPWLAATVERALSSAATQRFADGLALERALGAKRSARGRASPIALLVGAVAVGVVAVLVVRGLSTPPPTSPSPPAAPKETRTLPRPADASPGPAATAVSEAKALVESGAQKYGAGDLEGSVRDFTRAIALDPRSPAGWAGRARARGDLGDWAEAASDLTRLLELDPQNPKLYANRATARQSSGDREGAKADYGKAIELDPSFAPPWHSRGVMRKNDGDLAGAIDDYTHAIEADPDLAIAWADRGAALQNKGDREGAIRDYEKFVALAPDDARAREARIRIANLRGGR